MQNNGDSGYLKPKGSGNDQSLKLINDEKPETGPFNIPSQTVVDELGYLVLTGDESIEKRSSVSGLTNDVEYFKHRVTGHEETTSSSSSPSIPAENYSMQIHHTYFGLGDSLELDPKESQVEDDSFRDESHAGKACFPSYVTLEEDRGTEAIQHTYAGLTDFSKEDENGHPPSRIREGKTLGAPGHAHPRCDDDDDGGTIDTNVNEDEKYWEIGHDDLTSSTIKQTNDSDRNTKPLYCTGESLVDEFGYLVLTDDCSVRNKSPDFTSPEEP